MYSLDVNFLKDRTGDVVKSTQTTTIPLTGDDLKKRMPIYIGAGVMVLLPALAMLGIFVLNWQKDQTQANIEELEMGLAQRQGEQRRIQEVQSQAATLHQEADGLIEVFNQIKPWSALFQEMINQLPPQVQVESIQQEGNVITVSGFAGNYGAVNDFVLTLQSSPFLRAEQTKLTSATAAALPVIGDGVTAQTGGTEDLEQDQTTSTVLIPPVVKYTIQTEITETPDQELILALVRNQAQGIVARFRYLELKGILERPADAPEPPPPPPPAEGEAEQAQP